MVAQSFKNKLPDSHAFLRITYKETLQYSSHGNYWIFSPCAYYLSIICIIICNYRYDFFMFRHLVIRAPSLKRLVWARGLPKSQGPSRKCDSFLFWLRNINTWIGLQQRRGLSSGVDLVPVRGWIKSSHSPRTLRLHHPENFLLKEAC